MLFKNRTGLDGNAGSISKSPIGDGGGCLDMNLEFRTRLFHFTQILDIIVIFCYVVRLLQRASNIVGGKAGRNLFAKCDQGLIEIGRNIN